MSKEIVELKEDVSESALYSEDLAPVSKEKRTWSMWNLAALWVGMAVCIPTYLLASYMIKSGLSWVEALIIIGVANLIITVPMVLNGHAGVKYGIPFPVIGRSSFGTKGIHFASVVRGIVACGWFGVQTWIGGLAIYAIFNAITGAESTMDLTAGKFICFILFWFVNMYFIWKGTESIKRLEIVSAPILILMGILLIWWGANKADGFGVVLEQSKQLENPSTRLIEENNKPMLTLNPLGTKEGELKANEYKIITNSKSESEWTALSNSPVDISKYASIKELTSGDKILHVQFRKTTSDKAVYSSKVALVIGAGVEVGVSEKLWKYIIWLTAMVGFWATMSLSIADITRYAKSQKAQVVGQFIGLPGTMMLYSFVGIFVTCAAVINFDDILIADDAPWDPVSLLSRFESPVVVIVAQIFMLIATLSTNIAANVIAPSNAFSNLFPKKLSFKGGGTVTGIIGILICPWWLLDEISGILIFISGLLGPVLGILIADYFVVRKKNIQLAELYKVDGIYNYGGSGFNKAAMVSLALGVFLAIIGYWIPVLAPLYSLSWFTGFIVAFVSYILLMKNTKEHGHLFK